MRDAALYLESLGISAIDINMGCPVRKVVKTGGGSAMMTELTKTQALVRGMVESLKIPVTAKMRLGWDDDNLTAPDLAHALEDAGIAAIFVHGRTRAQGFEGTVKLAGIRKVVEAVKSVPVVGNGDVTTPEAAKRMFEETGCAGVSIGRGAFYNPWVFNHARHYIETGELLPEPTFEERIQVLLRHYDLMVEVFGEDRGSIMFRKVAPWYAKRFGPAKPFNKAVVQIKSREDFEEVLAQYLEWREKFTDEGGYLLPQYQLPPMVASFMQEPETAVEKRKAIPVPKGPVEVW
jgi:nifR3 family TIM-barrel protein